MSPSLRLSSTDSWWACIASNIIAWCYQDIENEGAEEEKKEERKEKKEKEEKKKKKNGLGSVGADDW